MNIFNIYLPIAGIYFNILLLILIGFCVGVIGGFFGIGGGWMVTPALNIFGFHMAYAIGTSLARLFGQSFVTVKSHKKMGNIDWKLGLLSIIPSLIGFEAGSGIVIDMEKAGDVGLIIRWCYVVFLLGLSSFMFYDYFVLQYKAMRIDGITTAKKTNIVSKVPSNGIAEKLHNINLRPFISLPKSKIEKVSLWVIVIIFLFTGFLAGILGIGGGFLILPALVYLVGLPTIIAVGTSLITVFATATIGCFTYGLEGKIEIYAAAVMLFGASIGAQIGAAAVKFIKGYGIRLLFAIMIMFTGLSVISEQFYKMTFNPLFQDSSGIILMGTAVVMTTIIIVKLIKEYRKENLDKKIVIK